MNFVHRHAYDFGAGLAALVWPFFFKRRRISVENILKCGVASDEKEAKRIAKKAWCHLAGHICEALAVPNVVTKDDWRDHLDVSEADPEAARLLLDEPETPILLVSAHHGVWEAATNVLSFARPMIAIARVMNNKLVAKWMKNHHFRGPVTVIDKNHGFNAGDSSPVGRHEGGDDDTHGPAHVEGSDAVLPRPQGADVHLRDAARHALWISDSGWLVRPRRAVQVQARRREAASIREDGRQDGGDAASERQAR